MIKVPKSIFGLVNAGSYGYFHIREDQQDQTIIYSSRS